MGWDVMIQHTADELRYGHSGAMAPTTEAPMQPSTVATSSLSAASAPNSYGYNQLTRARQQVASVVCVVSQYS